MIADGKRGDIGSTARAYAAAYLEGDEPLADALTVNPYLGRESIEPYLAAARRQGAGIFCVVKTSNAGGDVQDVALSDGRPLWQHVASLVADWGADLIGERGLSAVGAVVGATHARAVAEARKLMPQTVLLLPGVGAQGASPGDLARAFTSGPASASSTRRARSTTPSASRATTTRRPPVRKRRVYATRSGRCPGGSGTRALVAAVRDAGRVPWSHATLAVCGVRAALHSSATVPTRLHVTRA